MSLLEDVCFSTGAAETDRAKARIALWKADFILVDVLLEKRSMNAAFQMLKECLRPDQRCLL